MWSIRINSSDVGLGVSEEGASYIGGKGEFVLRVIDDEEHSDAEDQEIMSRISNIKKDRSQWLIVGIDYEPSDFSGPIVRNLLKAARNSPSNYHGMMLFSPAMADFGYPDSLTSMIILPEAPLVKVRRLFEMALLGNLQCIVEIQSRRFWSEFENQQASSWKDFESGIPHLFSAVEFSIRRGSPF